MIGDAGPARDRVRSTADGRGSKVNAGRISRRSRGEGARPAAPGRGHACRRRSSRRQLETSPMDTRRFGRTGIEISELTLGAGFVGGLLIHATDDEKRACTRACLEAGVNWIDTAAAYGDGASEKALNWLLAELPAEERPYLSTKFRLDTDAARQLRRPGPRVARSEPRTPGAGPGRPPHPSQSARARTGFGDALARRGARRRGPPRAPSRGGPLRPRRLHRPRRRSPPSALRSNRTVSTWRRSTTTC